ncbi:MAG TPA: hypothetical protein VFQ16_03320 [Burkholderiaceae bacterium]|nr:hypothetical protein [Burkholderiaceae bacterium]
MTMPRRSRIGFAALMATLLCGVMSGPAWAQQPRAEPPHAQIAAIDRLAWLEGVWEGGATFMTPAGASPVRSWERVVRAAGGTALLIQGRHFSAGPEGQAGRLVHDAAALLTFDERSGRYRFVTQTAEGRSGSFEGRVEDGVFSWFIPRPGGQVRYDIVRNAQGQWQELGFNCTDGAACTEFFRMTLERKSAP